MQFWSDVGAVVLFVLILALVILGGRYLLLSMVSSRDTAQGTNTEELMFHDRYVRRLDKAAGMPVAPRWWERVLHRP